MTPAERETLSRDRWFGALPPERQALLLDIGHVRAVRDRALLYGVGDEPDGLWAVLEGEVRLVSYPAVGMELVGLIVGTGGWFGELSVLDGGPRPHDAICFGPARVVNLPMDEVSRLAAARPEIYRDIALLGCAHQRGALAVVGQSLAQPVRVRLARTLAASVRAAADASPGVLRIRQEDLAAMVGVSRQTLNKLLKSLERAGIVELSYAQITIRDPAALRAAGHPKARD